MLIHTLEGVMCAQPGDWIIRGVKGELYPCKPDIFAATYEPVPVTRSPPDHTGSRSYDAHLWDIRMNALEEAAMWHDKGAEKNAASRNDFNRYAEDVEDRQAWRALKDSEDRHRSYAAAIRALNSPPTSEDAK